MRSQMGVCSFVVIVSRLYQGRQSKPAHTTAGLRAHPTDSIDTKDVSTAAMMVRTGRPGEQKSVVRAGRATQEWAWVRACIYTYLFAVASNSRGTFAE